MNKISLFFNAVKPTLATTRVAKITTLGRFDANGVLLDFCEGNVDNAYDSLVLMHEPIVLEVAS